jgi:hypothetical protein
VGTPENKFGHGCFFSHGETPVPRDSSGVSTAAMSGGGRRAVATQNGKEPKLIRQIREGRLSLKTAVGGEVLREHVAVDAFFSLWDL